MPEVVVNRNCNASGVNIQSRISITAGALYVIDESIPGSSEPEVALVIDVSQLKACYFISDVALQLNFNDDHAGSPSKQITLAANQAFSWDNLSGHANPFGSTDVTSVFAYRSVAGAARLRGFVAVDPTV